MIRPLDDTARGAAEDSGRDPVREEIILANLGTPAAPTPDAVRAFLDEFLSDPLVVDFPRPLWRLILRGIILRTRPKRVAHAYASIWTEEGSPLVVGTRRMVRALQDRLGPDHRVRDAYRYGDANLERALRSLRDGPAERVTVVPLFPQRTSSSSGSIAVEVERVRETQGWGDSLRVLELPPDDPEYLDAIADRIREAESERGPFEHLLLSFHGVPVRYDRREGGQYTRDCQATTAGVLERLGRTPGTATLTFQSRFGPETWLQPATADRIEALAREGCRRIGVVNPGFLTEGLETIEEIGIQGAEAFRAAGGEELVRIAAVEDHPSLIASLTERIRAEAIRNV